MCVGAAPQFLSAESRRREGDIISLECIRLNKTKFFIRKCFEDIFI